MAEMRIKSDGNLWAVQKKVLGLFWRTVNYEASKETALKHLNPTIITAEDLKN